MKSRPKKSRSRKAKLGRKGGAGRPSKKSASKRPNAAKRSMRKITAAQAKRIAMKYDAALRLRGAEVLKGRSLETLNVFGNYANDCWIIHPPTVGQPSHLGASYLIFVDKRTGRVVRAGRHGE
jgi:hypothetical protein